MYEALEGTLLAVLAAGGVYALTHQPEPLLTPEPLTFTVRWPERFRPSRRRRAEEAAGAEADSFISELHDDTPAARHRHPPGPGRHRRGEPMKLSHGDLPSVNETVPVAPAPGHAPWEAVQLHDCSAPAAHQRLALPQPEPLPEPKKPRPLRVYEGPDQQDPPTGVLSLREVLEASLGDYLNDLPEYPKD